MGAENVYVCLRRTDIPRGVLQVTDLEPNESQRNLVYTTPGQGPLYLRRGDSTAAVTSGASPIIAARDLTGLAAYLIDHVEAGGLALGTAALTAAEANSAAAAIVALVNAGSAVTIAAVNAAIAGVVADSELVATTSASTGDLEELISILAGRVYTVPSGSVLDSDGSTFEATVSGSFDDSTFRFTYNTSSFILSNNTGQISKLKAATFSYLGTAGAAVVCYSNTGAVL